MDIKRAVTESFQKIVSVEIQQKELKKESGSGTSSTVKDKFEDTAKNGSSLFDVPKINDGIDGGHIRPHVPGGSDQNHNDPSTTAKKLPEGETPGQSANKNKDLQSKNGELVHPKDFTKENQLRNLLNPWKEVKQDGPTNKPANKKKKKDPNNVINDMGKGPSISDGKNRSSRRSEASSGKNSSSGAPTSGQPGFIGPLTEWRTKVNDQARKDRENPPSPAPKEPEPSSKEPKGDYPSGEGGLTLGRIWGEITHAVFGEQKFTQPGTNVGGPRGTPNPENDTGDGHGPAILNDLKTPKSIGQIEEEKRRQVTLPGEGQAHERVHADQKETLQEGQRKRTDGRINPGRNDDGTTTSTGPQTVKPGFGTERVDGRPGHNLGSGLTTPGQPAPSGGVAPDSPVAENNSSSEGDDQNNA